MKIKDARSLKANEKVFQLRKGTTTHPPEINEYVVADVEEKVVYWSDVVGSGVFLLVVYNPTFYANLLADFPTTGLTLISKGITLMSNMQISIRGLEKDAASAREKYEKMLQTWQLTQR
jgi:hypothetical protein